MKMVFWSVALIIITKACTELIKYIYEKIPTYQR